MRGGACGAARLILVGAVRAATDGEPNFSRSLVHGPDPGAECFVLRDLQLQKLMNLISGEWVAGRSIEIGRYVIDDCAKAYLAGNKLFQCDAAVLGSTGSGKSLSYARCLRRSLSAQQLNSGTGGANLPMHQTHEISQGPWRACACIAEIGSKLHMPHPTRHALQRIPNQICKLRNNDKLGSVPDNRRHLGMAHTSKFRYHTPV